MFDFLEDFDTMFADIVDSDVFQIAVRVLVIYIVLIWLAAAFWAYRDMRLRSASAVAPYVAAATIIIFTPIFFLFALLLYRIVRPKETIGEVNERALAEEAMMAEVASHAHCANCSRPVHEDWIICPTCRNRLRRVCPNCEHLIELDWTLCAWCGKDFERAEAPGTAAFMPAAGQAARPQQLAPPQQPMPQQPPPQRVPPPQPPPAAKAPTTATPASAQPPTAGGATASTATPAASAPAGSSKPPPPTQPQQPAPRSSQAASSTPPSTGVPPPSGTLPATGER